MSGLNPWKRFIDKTARKPEGKWAIKNYADPKAHYRSFRIIIEALALRPDDIYCEIGCGGGVLLDMAMSKVKEGVALDHSQAMVALSTEKNRKYVDQGRLEIHMGNAEQLPWDSNRFTACASANMFFFRGETGSHALGSVPGPETGRKIFHDHDRKRYRKNHLWLAVQTQDLLRRPNDRHAEGGGIRKCPGEIDPGNDAGVLR